jgi:hypothetical protein
MHVRTFLSGAALIVAIAPIAASQVTITPMAGGYIAASDVNEVSSGARNLVRSRDGTLSLGANIDFGMLRGTLAYASGTTIKSASSQELGKGSMYATTADLVLRPLPRILVQPYVIAGAGEKFYRYDESASVFTGGNTKAFGLHGGLGADVMMGSVGVAGELTDFVSRGADDKWDVHDAFLMVGLKLRLGGK